MTKVEVHTTTTPILVGITENNNPVSVIINQEGGGQNGESTNGWSPLHCVVADGDRRVIQLYGWTGGTGIAPGITGYLGDTGIVPDIAEGTSIRGEDSGSANIDLGMRISNGYLQYSIDGGDSWINISSVEDLTGPQGAQGEKGDMGPAGPAAETQVPTPAEGDEGKVLSVGNLGEYVLRPITFQGNTLPLDSRTGRFQMGVANNSTQFVFGAEQVIGGWGRVWSNAAAEPILPVTATKIHSAEYIPGSDNVLFYEKVSETRIEYFFLPLNAG